MQVEDHFLQFHARRIEPGEIQDVVDELQQMVAGLPDDPHILQFLGIELAVEQQSRGTDDAVHRRADLVAHHGKKFRARTTGRLRRVARIGQVAFDPLAFGDVGVGAHRAAIRQQRGADFQHRTIRPGSLVHRNARIQPATFDQLIHRRGHFMLRRKFTVLDLPPEDAVETDILPHQFGRQAQQLADAAIDHRDTAIPVHHDDALAHVFQGGGQGRLIAGQPAAMAGQHSADRQHQ